MTEDMIRTILTDKLHVTCIRVGMTDVHDFIKAEISIHALQL